MTKNNAKFSFLAVGVAGLAVSFDSRHRPVGRKSTMVIFSNLIQELSTAGIAYRQTEH